MSTGVRTKPAVLGAAAASRNQMLDRRRGLREIISAAGHAVGDLVSRAELERPKKSAPSRQRAAILAGREEDGLSLPPGGSIGLSYNRR